jgi:pilus assembly protein CpaD
VLDGTTVQVDLRFPPGSSGLAAREAARLRGLAATQIAPSDRVLVAAGGSPGLAAARIGTISTELLRYGVVASPMKIAGIAPDRAIVEAVRHQVTLPPCPNWSKWPAGAGDFTNTVASNFGCANATNLGRMVASPTDLASGQPLGPAAAMPATAAVTRYLTDKVTPPGPGAAAGGAGAGGAGGSTAGGP